MPHTKYCAGECAMELSITKFRSHIAGGKRYYRGICRDCENTANRNKKRNVSRSSQIKSYTIIPMFTYKCVKEKLDNAIRNELFNKYSLRGAFKFFVNTGSPSKLSKDEKMTIIKAWETIRYDYNPHLWIWSEPDKCAILVRGTTSFTDAVKSLGHNSTIYREWSAINDVLEWSKDKREVTTASDDLESSMPNIRRQDPVHDGIQI